MFGNSIMPHPDKTKLSKLNGMSESELKGNNLFLEI